METANIFGVEIPVHDGVVYEDPFRISGKPAKVVLLDDLQPMIKSMDVKPVVETNVFDEEEVYTDCTVQVLRNSVTGEESVGWWKNADGNSEVDY